MLQRLRGRIDVTSDIDEMALEKHKAESERQLSTMELLQSRDLRHALIVGVGLMVAQQFSGRFILFLPFLNFSFCWGASIRLFHGLACFYVVGINVIFYFSSTIFSDANISNGELVTVLVCFDVNLFL